MPRQAIVSAEGPDERDAALRPHWLREFIGQKEILRRLTIVVNASKRLREPLPHILFDGPRGLGKTTLAMVLPNELGKLIQICSGPALAKPGDLLPFLSNADGASFIFIVEIHRLSRATEEFLYPALHDFRADLVLGEGLEARTINLKLKHFTLIGATTRSGLLPARLRESFGIHEHFEFYIWQELAQIVWITARKCFGSA
jgi:Holliday junction DNA helicase RuvB